MRSVGNKIKYSYKRPRVNRGYLPPHQVISGNINRRLQTRNLRNEVLVRFPSWFRFIEVLHLSHQGVTYTQKTFGICTTFIRDFSRVEKLRYFLTLIILLLPFLASAMRASSTSHQAALVDDSSLQRNRYTNEKLTKSPRHNPRERGDKNNNTYP